MKLVALCVCLAACSMLAVPAYSESVSTGKFHTKQSIETVYTVALNAVALHYDVTKADQGQGIIQADKRSWTHEVYGKVFVTVTKETDGVVITATFRRSAVTKFEPITKWALAYGDDLKKSLPDLTVEVEKQ